MSDKQELSDVLKNVEWEKIPYHFDTDAEDWVDDPSVDPENIPPPQVFIYGSKEGRIYKGPSQRWTPAKFMGNIIFYTNYPGGREIVDPQTKNICNIGEYAQSRWNNILKDDKIKNEISILVQNDNPLIDDVEKAQKNMYLFSLFELGGVRKLALGLKEIEETYEKPPQVKFEGIHAITSRDDMLRYYEEIIGEKNEKRQ